MSIRSIVPYLQGQRPGMQAGRSVSRQEEALAAILYPDTLFASTIAIQQQVKLADVSFWQEEIDFAQMKAEAIAGVIIRAGQRTWVDVRFKENWRKAKAAGLPRGSYFFYDSREDPKKQAALWWEQIREDPGELVHVADLEESYGGPFGTKAHFKEFLLEFQRLSQLPDQRIAVYTGFYWWLKRVGDDPFFRQFSLWLAWYAVMSLVRVPPPWTERDLLFWQYTASGDGPLYGASSQEIDLNWYCCDLDSYRKRFLFTTGDPMPDYIFSITPLFPEGSSVRPEPDTGNTKLTIGLPYGRFAYGNRRITIAEDRFENNVQVNKSGDIWLEVLEVNGTALPAPAYIAQVHLGRQVATITQIGTIPTNPPPSPGDDIVITQTFASPGYISQTITTTLKPE
jgi:Lyzozyme M1 (1,4-beta-N-acetylmuramidase)